MEETISLNELIEPIQKRLWLVVLIALTSVVFAAGISYLYLTPVYKAETQIIVQSESVDHQFDISDLQTSLQLVNTYSVIIKSPRILDEVVKELNLAMTGTQLSNKIKVSSAQQSQVLNIAVESEDPEKAVNIVNTIARVFQKNISNIMNVNNVSFLSKAEIDKNPQPVSPNPPKNMAVALVLGLMIGTGLCYLLEYLDNTLKDETDIERSLNLPILGAVTEIDTKGTRTVKAMGMTRKVGGNIDES